MPEFQHVMIPDGDLITIDDGNLVIGDRPIVGSLRGDGIGLDITPAMENVVGAAVAKAYGGKRTIQWCSVYVGLEALQRYGEVLPQEAIDALFVIFHKRNNRKKDSSCCTESYKPQGRCPLPPEGTRS